MFEVHNLWVLGQAGGSDTMRQCMAPGRKVSHSPRGKGTEKVSSEGPGTGGGSSVAWLSNDPREGVSPERTQLCGILSL